MTEKQERWVRCKGCGGLLGLFPQGKRYGRYHIKPGGVAHEKPSDKVNVPDSVTCMLYRTSSSAELTAMHADSPEIAPPQDLRPVSN